MNGNPVTRAVRRWALDRFAGLTETDPEVDPTIAVDPDRLTGRYLHSFGWIDVTEADEPGHLRVAVTPRDDVAWQPPAQAPATIAPYGPRDFRSVDLGDNVRTYRFDLDEDGSPAAWIQPGYRRALASTDDRARPRSGRRAAVRAGDPSQTSVAAPRGPGCPPGSVPTHSAGPELARRARLAGFSRPMRPLPPDRIDLGDLVARWMRPTDVEALVDATRSSFDELHVWMPWATDLDQMTVEAITGFYERTEDEKAEFRSAAYLITVPPDDRPLGTVGAHARIDEGGVEIGYWLRTDTVGRGLVTRTVSAVDRCAPRPARRRPRRDPLRRDQRRSAAVPDGWATSWSRSATARRRRRRRPAGR